MRLGAADGRGEHHHQFFRGDGAAAAIKVLPHPLRHDDDPVECLRKPLSHLPGQRHCLLDKRGEQLVGANQLLSSLVEKAVPLTWKMAEGFAKTLNRVIVVPERMRENLDRSGGAIASEKLMMVLAPAVGRAQAHDLVHHVLEHAMEEGISPRVAILADTEIGKYLTVGEIEAALDPASYVGDSVEIAESAAELAVKLSLRFRRA